MKHSSRATVAVTIMRSAVQLADLLQRELVTPALTKQDKSPVTVADFAIQALVSRMLLEYFPGESLVGEEEAGCLASPEQAPLLEQIIHYVGQCVPIANPGEVCDWIDRGAVAPSAQGFWTLDPIDGTKGFLRKEQFAVALAWVEHNVVQLGLLGCPRLTMDAQPVADAPSSETGSRASLSPGLICLAERGQGAWALDIVGSAHPRRLAVSEIGQPRRARLLKSAESGHTNVDQLSVLAHRLGSTAPPIGLDSQAKYALLAAGQAELLVRLLSPEKPNYRERIWDQAAGAIVLEEAGGKITDLDGKPLDFSCGRGLEKNRGVLASNGLLHEPCLQALKEIGA